jgi:hypothetical protein
MVPVLYLTSIPVWSKNQRLESYHICRFLTQIGKLSAGIYSYFYQVLVTSSYALPPFLMIGKNLPVRLSFYSERLDMVDTSWVNISYLSFIRVVVDLESNKIFSNLLDLTVPMISTTIMATGVKFLIEGVLEALFLPLFLMIDSDSGSKASAM